MRQQVVVIGLGRFGSSAARSLYNLGHDVLAIDIDDRHIGAMGGKAPANGGSNDAGGAGYYCHLAAKVEQLG